MRSLVGVAYPHPMMCSSSPMVKAQTTELCREWTLSSLPTLTWAPHSLMERAGERQGCQTSSQTAACQPHNPAVGRRICTPTAACCFPATSCSEVCPTLQHCTLAALHSFPSHRRLSCLSGLFFPSLERSYLVRLNRKLMCAAPETCISNLGALILRGECCRMVWSSMCFGSQTYSPVPYLQVH